MKIMTGMRPPAYNDTMKRKSVDPPSKYRPTISASLDNCIMKMIEPKSRYNRHRSVWDLISEVETLPDNY